jgi:hypothetical protein
MNTARPFVRTESCVGSVSAVPSAPNATVPLQRVPSTSPEPAGSRRCHSGRRPHADGAHRLVLGIAEEGTGVCDLVRMVSAHDGLCGSRWSADRLEPRLTGFGLLVELCQSVMVVSALAGGALCAVVRTSRTEVGAAGYGLQIMTEVMASK